MEPLRKLRNSLYDVWNSSIATTLKLKGPSQPMCIARRDPISGYFLCHRNSDLTRLKKKAYLSVDFVHHLSNVLKVFSVKVFIGRKSSILSRMFRDWYCVERHIP